MQKVQEPAVSGKGEHWTTSTPQNTSPVERERDAQIVRAVLRDGRPLSSLGVVAEQTGERWSIEVLDRVDLLQRLDTRARSPGLEIGASDMLKAIAAWIRGLSPGVCPKLCRWDNGDGTYSYQRCTIERERWHGRARR